MSHFMTALAMRQQGLKPAAKIVLYWLADHHNSETGRCFPSLNKLAEECEMDKATVVRHLAALEALGLIERSRRTRDNGSRTSTEYSLNLTEQPVAKCNSPCRKMQQPPVAKCDSLNLVNNNLGNEPKISPLTPKGEWFDEFWSTVPKKVGKGSAQKAWVKACKSADPQTIIDGMRRYAAEREGKDPQYTAHPASWLNAGRWTDEASTTQQDFHNYVSKALEGQNAISGPGEIDHRETQRISAPIQTTGPSGPERGADRTSGNGRGNERAYADIIRPRRFGGADY